MIKNHNSIIRVESKNAPVVEFDSAAHAAYVRFSTDKVRRTLVVDVQRCLVTVDLNQSGDVVGIELIGVPEFSINKLIEKAGVRGVTREMIRNTRYVPAKSDQLELVC